MLFQKSLCCYFGRERSGLVFTSKETKRSSTVQNTVPGSQSQLCWEPARCFFSSPSLELFHFDDSSAFYLWHHHKIIWSFSLFKLIQNVCSLSSFYSTTSTYLYTSDRQITPTVTPCWNRWTFARFMTNSQKRKEVWRSFIARVPRIPSS